MTARLYLVDDHAIVRQSLRALLSDAGYQVIGDSGDLTEALADVQRLQPEVLLLDLSLGERSGLELLTEVQQRRLPMRCLVLTMSSHPRHVATALRLGAAGYVLKGSSAEDLLTAIERVRSGSRHLGPEVGSLVASALATEGSEDPFSQLSARERQVVVMVVNGNTSAEIAAELHVSPKTVESYRSRLMAKLGTGDITALVKLAMRHGLTDFDAH